MKNILIPVLVLGCFFSFGQTGSGQKVPLDPAIRYGKLKNGMTYYIRHNEVPKNRVSFFLAQNVGAVLENDDQNGLAHFLEHMAFNGTEHFKEKGIIRFLEKHGVALLTNINAYTAKDETVYILSDVPAADKSLVDSCLLVLHDWSHYLLLTDEEIDAERGVVAEEWRNHQQAGFRMEAKQDEILYQGSNYATRDVTGDINVIQHFSYQTLRDFYHDWYRTDLQAIIVVGDIDVDAVEQTIKNMFPDIPAVKNPREKMNLSVPDNKEPVYGLVTDKEAVDYSMFVMFKIAGAVTENKDEKYMENMYVRSLFNTMMSNRIVESRQGGNYSFGSGRARIDRMVRTKDAAIMDVRYKEGKWEPVFRELATVVEQVRDFGFTQTELDRAKKALLSEKENAWKTRDRITNIQYALKCKDNFMDNTPLPGIDYEYRQLQDLLPRISLADLQALAGNFMTDENMVIVVSGPEKEGHVYQTKDEVIRVLNEVKNARLKPYVDTYVDKPLLAKEPVAGKIKSRKEVRSNDLKAVELQLSNGIRVYYRQSDIEKETIKFNAHSWGGRSLLRDDQLDNELVLSEFLRSYGIGDFSTTELSKKLTGKKAGVGFGIDDISEVLNGSASPKDVETMFQLLYLRFTSPRFDTAAYRSTYARIQTRLGNREKDINRAFRDSVTLAMSDHHPRVRILNENLLKHVSFEGIKEVYEDRYANPADFTFTFSGNFDPVQLEAYIEKYIASLPVTAVREKVVDQGIRPPAKNKENYFLKDLTANISTVYINLHNKFQYNQQNDIYAYIIAELLDKRYFDEMREKEGGIYSASVQAVTREHPYGEWQLTIEFNCAPENRDKMKRMALAEIDQLMKGKIVQADLDKIKSNILKKEKEEIEKLEYWHSLLIGYAVDGKTKMSHSDYTRFVNSIDAKTVVKKANQFLKDAVKVEVVMSNK